MRRTACVDLPAFALQVLLRRQPDWRAHPVAVVESVGPRGMIHAVNRRAQALGVRPGMRHAAALTLAAGLRAGPVAVAELHGAADEVVERLLRFTPGVEPAVAEPGVFWLDARGLERLHASLARWAEQIRAEIERLSLRPTLVVGFSRYGSYAVARATRGVLVLSTPAEELAAARGAALDRLGLPVPALEALRKLGIDTAGAFADLPAAGIARRFGPRAWELHRQATGGFELPLAPRRRIPPGQARARLDDPETRVSQLLAVIERLLRELLDELARRGRKLAGVHVGFRFDRLGEHVEHLKPAAPTLDAAQVLGLVRLRLAALRRLPDSVIEIQLLADEAPDDPRQPPLEAGRPRRDLSAANRALACVRAELGDDAVTRARLREAHLPEAAFGWEPLVRLDASRPREAGPGRAVRRIYVRPQGLARRPRHEPDGWMPRGPEQGPVLRSCGPYVVAGGWWDEPVHREYHFAELRTGEIVWVYYDRREGRWFLHGRVE